MVPKNLPPPPNFPYQPVGGSVSPSREPRRGVVWERGSNPPPPPRASQFSASLVNGSMQLPQDRLWLLREIVEAALHYRDAVHASPFQTTPGWAWYGFMLGPIFHPTVSRVFFAMAHPTSRADIGVYHCALHASVLCPLEICVALHKWRVQFNGECNLLPHLHALYWHSRWVTGLQLRSRLQ